MSEIEENSYFKQFDGGTLFTALQFWEYEEEKTGKTGIRSCVGTWAWEDVKAVIGMMEPHPFTEMEGPKCSIFWEGGHLHLLAPYQTVLRAYRAWRKKYKPSPLTFTTPS